MRVKSRPRYAANHVMRQNQCKKALFKSAFLFKSNDAQHWNIKPFHPSKCNEWGSTLWASELITARTLKKLLR